jgi:hypothetical protein
MFGVVNDPSVYMAKILLPFPRLAVKSRYEK